MKEVLITGADGYLGSSIANTLYENQGAPLVLFVHANGPDEIQKKESKLKTLFSSSLLQNSKILYSDLAQDRPFSQVEPDSIGSLFHGASVIRFNIDRDTAEKINIQGSKKCFEFAKTCPNLTQINLLSSLYASGQMEGYIKETPLPTKVSFTNHYEWSKYEAERLLLESYGQLPWNILRIGTVIADDPTGKVTQFNAFHNTMRLLHHGMIPFLPGDPDTQLYFLSRTLFAKAVEKIYLQNNSKEIFHITTHNTHAPTLEEIIKMALLQFKNPNHLRNNLSDASQFISQNQFHELTKKYMEKSGMILADALDSIFAYADQLYVKKSFSQENFLKLMGAEHQQEALELTSKTIKYCLQSKWGRQP